MQALVLEKARKEKEFYDNLFRSDNSLNKQLKASEDGKSAVPWLFLCVLHSLLVFRLDYPRMLNTLC
jgi:hypothetical protein